MPESRGKKLTAALPWLGLAGLTLWVAFPGPWALGIAAVGFGAAAISRSSRGAPVRWALVVGVAAVMAGFVVETRVQGVMTDGDGLWEVREAVLYQQLREEFDQLLDRSISTASTLAEGFALGNRMAFSELQRMRRTGGFDGLAVFDDEGRLVIWDGEHRGRVPENVRLGGAGFAYGDLPLASHFYVTQPIEGGGTAMVAILLESDLPEQVRAETGDFARRFRDRTGEQLRILRPDQLGDQKAAFSMQWEDQSLFSVVLERPTDTERLEGLRGAGQAIGLVFLLLVWALLVAGTVGGRVRASVAASSLLTLSLVLPPEAFPGLGALSNPAQFMAPLGISLGRLALVLSSGAIVAGLVHRVPFADRRGSAASLLFFVLGFPLVAYGFSQGASLGLLSQAESGWLAYTLILGGCLGLVAWLGFMLSPDTGKDPKALVTGTLLLVLLTAGAGAWAVRGPGVPAIAFASWVLPFMLLRGRLPGRSGGGLVILLVAGTLGMTAALPSGWGDRILARRAHAESQLTRLGTQVDPYLEFLMHRMAGSLEELDAIGARPVELLYQGWRGSGLAEASYPVWLTLWSPGGLPVEDLRVGTQIRARPGIADAFLDQAVSGDSITLRRFDEFADAHYLVEVPLRGGWVVTGVVPPLLRMRGTSLLGPLFGSLDEPGEEPLTLVPLLPGEVLPDPDLTWVRAETGWRGELGLTYPGAFYHAHYEVGLPGRLVSVARAGLLIMIGVGILTLLWAVGRALRGLLLLRRPAWVTNLRSFQARVTIALFAFFAVSNLGFGTLAYRTIAGASERAAQVLAERVVDEGASIYLEVQGQIDFLAQRVGSDLLEYREGALEEGSLDPLVQLGLYQGWVPYELHQQLANREVVQASRRTLIGGWSYVTAYRRLPDGDVLAAPVPLQAGASAVRSREVVHLLAFAMMGGALLSLVLALLTGRALARPIQTLRVASERVGSGNLRLKLPEDRDDEFGRVFEAFNRMVRRLRRARKSLLRTTQRTRAIVEDSATGVIAIDGQGNVSLVNPRAQELLGESLVEGGAIGDAIAEAADEGTKAVLEWVRSYLGEGPIEASADLQLGGRRLRIRGRRITREGPLDGIVVNIEDVTDELRAERVLAWGEMARQVAHEVKNPLTPIKLSIQHIRRAWADERPDFKDILTRNADAMLAEIDRLAEIATSFSRFGAPGDSETELEAVDLPRVIEDVLALYSSPEGGVRFEGRVEGSIPAVQARTSEVKEVLVNLLENARAAVGGKGLVTIHAYAGADAVSLAVVDDGSGIPAEILGRIFEPQFSTRSTGTGLGLAIVRRLVERWGGTVTARSREGEGTSLQIDFALWAGGGPETG